MIFGPQVQMPTDGGWSAKEIAERYGVTEEYVTEIGEYMQAQWEEYPTMNCSQMADHTMMSFYWTSVEDPEYEEIVSEIAYAVEEKKL